MSDEALSRAAKALGPYGDGAANSNQRLFTVTTSSQVHALPRTWKGRYVKVQALGGEAYYMFSFNSAATLDHTLAAAADGGGNPARGARLAQDASEHVMVPDDGKAGTDVYVVRRAAATASLEIRRADF